jgi:septum site-determining protein MinD
MTRIIGVVSGKGGVGKTTMVANIGTALAKMGKNVIILDANLTTPSLGLHLGVPLYPVTLHDVLKGRANIKDAIYTHDSGVKIIPAGLSLRDMRGVDSKDLPNALLDLLGTAEIIILDASAGFGRETLAAIEAADEIVIVTSPEISAVTDALKASKIAEQLGTKVTGVILNRVTGKDYEMSRRDILNMLDNVNLIGEVPEDIEVQRASSVRNPVVRNNPKSAASNRIMQIAASLVGEEDKFREVMPWYRKMFSLGR